MHNYKRCYSQLKSVDTERTKLMIRLTNLHDIIVTGSSGSCLTKFSPTPFMFCTIHNVCRYASRTATSFWLASQEPVPMKPVGSQSVMKYIGRCSVCQSPSPLLAVHSQNVVLPDCPRGWHPLWNGYSFVMVRKLELNVKYE